MERRLSQSDIAALRQLQHNPLDFKAFSHPALCASQFIESNGCGGCRVSAFGARFLAWLDRRYQVLCDLGSGL
ncbi:MULTISPECIES: hypothetical protein [unclassified Paludibacterium]|uniref:hypothetical protein n=1 Tax=unclassified Paludibacterium TaxID=2618429 RepID=UPI001C050B17|nr:hypothetical protein [Paludibacterium sp. B53371]BEV73068.1 hypothetical protein THUN1379_25500 [Paludibacterium sp. THUN1379]